MLTYTYIPFPHIPTPSPSHLFSFYNSTILFLPFPSKKSKFFPNSTSPSLSLSLFTCQNPPPLASPHLFPKSCHVSPLHQPHFKYKIKTETYPHFTSHYLLLHHHLLQRKKYSGKENGKNLKRRRGAPRAPVYYLLIGLFSHPPR